MSITVLACSPLDYVTTYSVPHKIHLNSKNSRIAWPPRPPGAPQAPAIAPAICKAPAMQAPTHAMQAPAHAMPRNHWRLLQSTCHATCHQEQHLPSKTTCQLSSVCSGVCPSVCGSAATCTQYDNSIQASIRLRRPVVSEESTWTSGGNDGYPP